MPCAALGTPGLEAAFAGLGIVTNRGVLESKYSHMEMLHRGSWYLLRSCVIARES